MMRFALVALVLGAGPALGQSLTIAPGAVQACHDATPIGEVYASCLGQASNACQDQPGGGTTIGIVDCITAETAAWDVILNFEYGDLRRRFQNREDGQRVVESLRDAQRAWIAFRDADCALQYDRWGNGSMRNIASSNCRMTMTARRAMELRDMGAAQ